VTSIFRVVITSSPVSMVETDTPKYSGLMSRAKSSEPYASRNPKAKIRLAMTTEKKLGMYGSSSRKTPLRRTTRRRNHGMMIALKPRVSTARNSRLSRWKLCQSATTSRNSTRPCATSMRTYASMRLVAAT